MRLLTTSLTHPNTSPLTGMAIVLNEAPNYQPHPPKHFPTCQNFAMSNEEYNMYQDVTYGQKPVDPEEGDNSKESGNKGSEGDDKKLPGPASKQDGE